MKYANLMRATAGLALSALGACKSLDIENPNEPDAARALADPSALEALTGGTLRTWHNRYTGMEAAGVLTTQAQSFSSSWNNFNMNFYSGIDNPTAAPSGWNRNSRSWQNDPAAAGRTSIEWLWTGMYSALSSANDVISAIKKGTVINTAGDTKRAETIATLMQGLAMSSIALNYDKGYIVDEASNLATLAYSTRKQVRDAAVAKLQAAATLAGANTFTTPAGWTNGRTYTNLQIQRIANTAAAMTLAFYPRNAAENGQVNWGQVATFAASGMSSLSSPTAGFDFTFIGDGCTSWCNELLLWFDGIDGGRVHTRVANMLDAATQAHPWPASGNPKPNAGTADKRLGDGSFGDESLVDGGFGTYERTANGGSDFAWSGIAPFRPDRGSYHQSNIAHVRYDLSGNQDPTGIYGGFGPAPLLTATLNDLLWAEALLRSSGSAANAATLINRTRVNRGGLSAALASESQGSLLTKLQYEQEVELMGIGALPFYNRRRIDGLVPGTPREMPVPARELGVLGQALYTWGGTNAPASPTPP